MVTQLDLILEWLCGLCRPTGKADGLHGGCKGWTWLYRGPECWRSTVHSGLLRLYGCFLIHSLLFAFYSVVGGHNQHMSVPFIFPSVLILETEVHVYFTFTPLISFYSCSKCT